MCGCVRMKRFDEAQVFDSIYNKLEEMESRGRVNLSVLEEFDLLMKRFKELELLWIERAQRAKVEDVFLLYHCSRNCWNVLNKIRTRFLEAEKKNLNPTIARDSQQVMPTLNILYEIVTLPLSEALNKEQQMLIIRRLKEMRDIASTLSLLPTFQEETKDINITKFRRHFREFAESLQASYFEE